MPNKAANKQKTVRGAAKRFRVSGGSGSSVRRFVAEQPSGHTT